MNAPLESGTPGSAFVFIAERIKAGDLTRHALLEHLIAEPQIHEAALRTGLREVALLNLLRDREGISVAGPALSDIVENGIARLPQWMPPLSRLTPAAWEIVGLIATPAVTKALLEQRPMPPREEFAKSLDFTITTRRFGSYLFRFLVRYVPEMAAELKAAACALESN